MAYCKRCLLPDKVPGANLDDHRICRFCREFSARPLDDQERRRKRFAEDLEQTLATCRGDGLYDCLVPFSGGKDSLYLLYRLKNDYGLRILGFTSNIDIPAVARSNIRLALDKLEIDHLEHSPPRAFYRKLFRFLLQNQEPRGAVYTLSYVYAPLFEGEAIRTAIEKRIPLILAGYSPGQPDPCRMHYEFSRKFIQEMDWTPPALAASGVFTEKELSYFYNPLVLPPGTAFPRYLAPLHAWPYNQEKIVREVVKRGLVKNPRHANPLFTNYPIHWLCMYSDLKHMGYNPYHPEFSALIREGKASRSYWRVMAPVVNWMIANKIGLGRQVSHGLRWLGLREEDLRITMPLGAYDPK